MFNRLNNYHPDIKLTIEVNPSKCLDTQLTHMNVPITSAFIRQTQNYLRPWKTPKFYKRNTIKSDLHRSNRISSLRQRNPSDKRKVYEGWLPVLTTVSLLVLTPCFLYKIKTIINCSVIYDRDCSGVSRYISEIKRNVKVRWNEHNSPTKSSQPLKLLHQPLFYIDCHLKCSKKC